MSFLQDALRAGHVRAPAAPSRTSVLVVGGGGALGSAVLERLLGVRGLAHVRVLVTQGFHAAMHGLEPLVVVPMAVDEAPAAPLAAELALVVFDRTRRANGREDAFVKPQPEALPALARWLFAGGVRRLVVVLPHSMASLPQALKAGLAGLDEHAVTTLGFEHLVFVRPAQRPNDAPAASGLQRLADGVIAQLRFMVPQAEQPVRVQKVAAFVTELVARLPASAPGTRVVPPELVWLAAQARTPGEVVQAWLDGRELPPVNAQRMRL
ncbi:MAG: hypothetical protein Q8R33_13575 [Burkholderiales bacterium]|nr:hypothetical protein [Burkholderiales bacterium]